MPAIDVFISYSHADEWLKDELIKHFAALVRNGTVDVWHDRKIPAGGILDDEIDGRIRSANIVLLLISNDFINSDYCVKKEYEVALTRRDKGEAVIVPIIIRECDWDIGRLKSFNALPRDAVAVTKNAILKSEAQSRDTAWLSVINGLKELIQAQKKSLAAPDFRREYIDNLFLIDFIRHPLLPRFDEMLIMVDPDIYHEKNKEQISTFESLISVCKADRVVLLSGKDRSGKTVIAKRIQVLLKQNDICAILLNGRDIKNADIARIVRTSYNEQYESTDYPVSRACLIIDDFDECSLNDSVKENIVEYICETFAKCVLTSYTNAPTVLFTSEKLPTPILLEINPFNDEKLYVLVEKWKRIQFTEEEAVFDQSILTTYEQLQIMFNQTELEKAPYTAVTLLELLLSSSGTDIAFSSFAAAYDSLISNRLFAANVNWRNADECKNFLALLAYRSYNETGKPEISRAAFDDCISIFEEQYLSSPAALKAMAAGTFLRESDDNFVFYEEYLWFFLVARYVVKTLLLTDRPKFTAFVDECTSKIFQKKYANIVIYIAYFSADNFVLESLLATLDGLFSRATDWHLSDDIRAIMLGFDADDPLMIESKSDVAENRLALIKEKIHDILKDAENVVAKYTLPFLNSQIGDSTQIVSMEVTELDADSYMRSVNALLRTHSVIGQILSSRSGTYSSSLVLSCIVKMVEASGRYASLNHAIATVLIHDREQSLKEVERATSDGKKSIDDLYEKTTKIFAFWSVYISQAGLARYLSQEHSIRALTKLALQYEDGASKTLQGNIPYNFTSVLVIAKLYHTGVVDRDEIEGILRKYGENSSIIAMLRVVFHIYAYYMPMDYRDKQWLAQKLQMQLRKMEVQRLKALEPRRLGFKALTRQTK